MLRNMTGPELFRARLKERGISLGEIERRLDVTRGTASRWASGERSPNLRHVFGIERELGIPPEAWVSEPAKGAA